MGDKLDFELSLGLQAPYTTDVQVRQRKTKGDTQARFDQLEFVVRLYHDVRMAEITDYQGAGQLTAIYPGKPNKRGEVPDEKRQLSRLLADWVKLCVHHGRRALVWEQGSELPQT